MEAQRQGGAGEQISRLASRRAGNKSNLVEIRGEIVHILSLTGSSETETFDAASPGAGGNKREEKV